MRRRLLFSYLTLTLFVLLALEVPLGVSFANAEHRRLASAVETEAFAIALRAGGSLAARGSNSADELASLAGGFHRRTGHGLIVVDNDGVVLTSSGPGEPRRGTDATDDRGVGGALRGHQLTWQLTMNGDDTLAAAVPVLDGSEAIGGVRVTA